MAPLPWIPISAQMHDHVMYLTGTPASRFYFDAPTMVNAFAEVTAYYGMDAFRPAGDIYNYEIEAMGGKMVYSDNAMPTIDFRDPLIKEPADLLRLKTPDFLRDGRLPFALECMRLAQVKTGSRGAGYFCGPFSMAVGLRSYPALIKDMRRRPEFVRDLLDFIVDQVTLPYIKAQKDYAGITLSGGADAWAMIPNLSYAELMQWSVPWGKRITEGAARFGVTAASGGGDYCEERPERFDAALLHSAFDVQWFQGRLFLGMGQWHKYPLQAVLDYTAKFRKAGMRIPLSASINARLLRDGPVADVIDLVRRYVMTFAAEHELAISIANIPADTPPAHVHAAVAAVHTLGRLPIRTDLAATEVPVPQREPFAEWRRSREGQR